MYKSQTIFYPIFCLKKKIWYSSYRFQKQVICFDFFFESYILAVIFLQTLMNTELLKLFDIYNFSLKDRRDFQQIFSLLPSHKKQHLLENFEAIAFSIQTLQSELHFEQEILLGETLEKIQKRVEHLHNSRVIAESK